MVAGLFLPHAEPGRATGRRLLVDLHRIDSSARRTVTHLTFESRDGLAVAFRANLHAPVRQIRHPAVQPLASRDRLGEIPKADSLHPSDDDVAPSEKHRALLRWL